MTMKKTLIGGLCIAAVMSTVAFGAKRHSFEGIYAAITGSVLGFESEAQVTDIYAFDSDAGDDDGYSTDVGISNDYGDNGFGGELAVGYGARGGNGAWALDGEIFINFVGATIEKNFGTNDPDAYIVEETIEAEESWGVRLKPGYFVHRQVKFFVPLALVQTNFEHEYNVVFADDNLGTVEEDEEATGFEVGFGVEAFLTPNTSVAVSATTTFYEEYNIDLVSGDDTSDVPEFVDNSYENSIYRGNVTFIYRF